MTEEKIKVYAVIGPTATGKSAYAIRLAKETDGEIISGDSMQIYKGMDIGTAKALPDEQQGVRHHLLDIASIDEPFSAGKFLELAKEAILDIHSRGKTPIVCGGTGLYIELLLTGKKLSDSEGDASVREKWQAYAAEHGNEALHSVLRSVDPVSADAIHPNNVKRVIRALEIRETTGMTKSQADERSRTAENPFAPVFLRLTTRDRAALYRRIDARVEKMFALGLEAEVRALCANGLRKTPTASQAIGYKEFYPYFDGLCGIGEVKEAICRNTRHYAKRQETWFAHMQTDQTVFAD